MAENNNFVQPAIPRFDGHYDHWSMLMENFLRSKEYWSLVEDGIPAAAADGVEETEAQCKAREDAKLRDLKVKNYLFQAIDRTIMDTILNKETAKGIWDSMRQKYQGSTKVKRAQLQALRREFEILGMKEGEKVDEYFARTLTIANKMKAHGEKMGELVIVEKILRSMTAKFDYVVCSIEESNNLTTMTIDELQSSLLVHEQRMLGHGGGDEQVLKATLEENFGTRGRGRGGFRGRGRGRGRQGFNKALVECYKCHKLGHFQYECPSWEKGVNYAELDGEEELLLMAHVEVNNSRREDVWFLDSGCSNHMSGNKKWFASFDEEFRHSVKLGNSTRMPVIGKGNIKLEVDGLTQVISDVYYVPELTNNLLSIGQLQEKNLAILIQHGACRIYHPRKGLIMQTPMTINRMFVLLANVVLTDFSTCLQTTSDDLAHLWHCRYGHLNYKGLRTLHYRRMVKGLPQLKASTKMCHDCLVGKQRRDSIPKKSLWRASQRLQLVHADICGPITPTSNSHKRYLLSFIDDYSRKMWIYFLTEKSEAFTMFKCYKNLVEKETGSYICCLRTDRGGEFTSNEFNEYCKANGIKRQLTTAYTPQQNGVAERRNRTIMNLVRSILSEKKVPKSFWPEAVNWITHVLNRSPTRVVQDATPEEAWSGVKPNVDYFRVFGCIAHVHIPDVKRTKLDDKSCKCVLLGVSEESKAYRLYNPTSRKIIVSRDVVFEENECWDWGRSVEEVKLDVLDWGDNDDKELGQNNGEEGDDANDGVIEQEHGEPGVSASSSSSSLQDTSPDSDEEGRNRRQPDWMKDYVSGEGLGLSAGEEELHNLAVFTANEDPITFDEAVSDSRWRDAMKTEIDAIERNNTWELTSLPSGVKKIGVKWVFKTKFNEKGEIDKCKARLVAKGYAQRFGIDYTEVYAPVARWDTIRMIIALAAQQNWSIYQLDVKSAFLHGELSEVVYVEQPQGFEVKGEEEKVYKLKKALYGLKQAPRAWYSRIENYFVKEGFEKCDFEHTLFIKAGAGGTFLIVSLYVDDLIFTGNCEHMFVKFKESMKQEFDMSDLSKMRYFLGVEVMQCTEGIYISQKKFARELLERFGMERSNFVANPIVPGVKLVKDDDGAKVDATVYKQMVGSLMYLTVTRPDLMFVVCLASRFMANPTELHYQVVKRVLRYVVGTVDLGIFYKRRGDAELLAYTDSDYAGDVVDRKSTSGYVFSLSGGAVSWTSKKQPIVTLSTTEAEYVAAASCATQGVWMKRVLDKLGHSHSKCITIFCDNSSAIKLSRNPVLHGRSKHIDVRFHFLRDLTKDGKVKLVHCGSKDQVADIMTKPLKLDVFEKLRELLGVCKVPNLN